MKSRSKGLIFAMMSSCSFGLMPLFSLPVMSAGIEAPSVIVYRFGFGAIWLMLALLCMGKNLRITWSKLWRVAVLGVFNMLTGITMVWGYNYMASGPATTIQFSYPIFTCVLMMLFFHERLTWRVALSIILAVIGVMGISGFNPSDMGSFSTVGLILELLSGLTYAIYLVLVPALKLENEDNLYLIFWVFIFSTLFTLPIAAGTSGIQGFSSVSVGINLVLMGLIPTAFSHITLIIGIRHVGSTISSILGALEPLTAMIVGILIFSEQFTALIALSFVLIIASVTLLILKK